MASPYRAAIAAVVLIAALPAAAAEVNWKDPQAIVEAALANSPALAFARARTTAAEERAAGAGSLPNPMLMTGVQDLQVNLQNDEMMTMYMVGASQTFTRGSKRTADRRFARATIRSAELQTESLRAEVERDVLFAYYDVAAADEQIRTVGQVREAVDAIVESARVRYEIGTATQAEVIRAQLERSLLERQVITARGARNSAAARLLPLLGLPPGTEVPPLELPTKSAEVDLDDSPGIPEAHPALAAAQADLEAQQQQVERARLETKPDLNLEASYGIRPEQTDMFSVLATIELPVRRKTLVEPRVAEARAQVDAAGQRRDQIRRQLDQDLGVAKAVHDEMNEQFRLHDHVLVPQARLAFESTLAGYQTGRSSFDSILSAETTYLGLQLQYYQYLARHLQAIIDYRQLQRGARSGRIAGAMTAAQASISTPSSGGSTSMNSM